MCAEMRFTTAANIESTVWQLKLADLPRANNRALIDALYNGNPPYSERQVRQNNINVNYNDLEGTRLVQEAQGQYSHAIFSPAQYFTVKVDKGPRWKRDEWSEIITQQMRKRMKAGQSALMYQENLRNVFAQLVLHGSALMQWSDNQRWCPEMQAIGDVMIPSGTYLTLDNLSYYAVYRRYTAYQLQKQITGPNVDPGWSKPLAQKCIEWAFKQIGSTLTTDWVYNPERVQEDFKCDSGIWNSDAIPTINVWDFYYLDDQDRESGWKRKIILDTPSLAGGSAGGDVQQQRVSDMKNFLGSRNQFLYDIDSRKNSKFFARNRQEIGHFQFADGSVVAPARYHAVRSFGWLCYSVLHIQNRLRCSFTEAAFEACMQYFRVTNPDDMNRAIKVNLINKGVIPQGVTFVNPQERWQVDAKLIQLVMAMNSRTIADNSTNYTKNFGYRDTDSPEKTATQISAEVNAATQLIGSMLEQFYSYQVFQDREIARRFCIKNSRDLDVRAFRKACLSQGVPEEILHSECWDVVHERIMGSGNAQQAMQQAAAIMSQYPLLDPNGQRVALRRFMFANTRDAALTEELVPSQPNPVTDAVHDAQMSASTLLMGIPMGLKQGVSHSEYAATLIGILGVEIQKVNSQGGVPSSADQLLGLQNIAGQTIEGQPMLNPDGSPGNGAAFHIQILSQDRTAADLVKQLGDTLGKQMNEVRAFAQRFAEQQQQAAAQNENGELAPEDAAKIKAQLLTAETKAQIMKESHDQRAQQRAEIHAQQMQENRDKSAVTATDRLRQTQVNETAKDVETAAAIRRQGVEHEAKMAQKPAPQKND